MDGLFFIQIHEIFIPMWSQVTCKVLNLRTNVWSDGPSLPGNPAASSAGSGSQFGLRPGVTRGTAYHKNGKVPNSRNLPYYKCYPPCGRHV